MCNKKFVCHTCLNTERKKPPIAFDIQNKTRLQVGELPFFACQCSTWVRTFAEKLDYFFFSSVFFLFSTVKEEVSISDTKSYFSLAGVLILHYLHLRIHTRVRRKNFLLYSKSYSAVHYVQLLMCSSYTPVTSVADP